MEIAVSDAGEVKVLRFEGKLDTKTFPDAQALLTELIEQGTTKVVPIPTLLSTSISPP